jgi:hypothetical protein
MADEDTIAATRHLHYRARINFLSAAGYRCIARVRCAFGGRSRLCPRDVKAMSEFFASGIST